jgi:hypothetical protein
MITNVSYELTACIFRVSVLNMQAESPFRTLANILKTETAGCSETLADAVKTRVAASFKPLTSALKMEAAGSYEMLLRTYQTTRSHRNVILDTARPL